MTLADYRRVKLAVPGSSPLTSLAGPRAALRADVIIADIDSSFFCGLQFTLTFECLPI